MCMDSTCLSSSYMKSCSWLGLSIEVVYFFHIAQAQDGQDSNKEQGPLPTPSTGVIISVLTVIFCVTCLLLVYAKFCQRNPAAPDRVRRRQTLGGLVRSQSGLSGIDKMIIESLPFFKFSSIKGSKEGLECAICISKYEDEETLRMLPKCKHAFHMKCIDQWLASHSSCPLCRYKVDPDDLKSFRYSFSSRLLGVPSNLSDDLNVDIFVQREPGNHQQSSRFGSNFRNMHNSKELEEVLTGNQGNTSCDDNGNWKLWHKFNHKIVISGVVTRSRWSDLNSSDLLSLKSEMLMDASSKKISNLESINNRNFHDTNDDEVDWRRLCESKFSHADTQDENSASALNPAEKRSISEITNVSRFVGTSMRSRSINEVTEKNGKEERLRRMWLPLARGTIQLFAGRQVRLQDQKLKRPVSYV